MRSSNMIFAQASSLGNDPQFCVTLRNMLFSDSIAFVVLLSGFAQTAFANPFPLLRLCAGFSYATSVAGTRENGAHEEQLRQALRRSQAAMSNPIKITRAAAFAAGCVR